MTDGSVSEHSGITGGMHRDSAYYTQMFFALKEKFPLIKQILNPYYTVSMTQ